MMRGKTAEFIEEQKAAVSTEGSGKKRGIGRGKHPNSRKGNANLKPFPKGVSGNPGGLPGTDLAAIAARRIFEQNADSIIEGMATQLKKGNAYAFSVLANRAYGKVKDRVEHTGADGVPLEVTVRLRKARSRMEKEPRARQMTNQ
jgi:hypothetical protein